MLSRQGLPSVNNRLPVQKASRRGLSSVWWSASAILRRLATDARIPATGYLFGARHHSTNARKRPRYWSSEEITAAERARSFA